ncbi:SymE family type I addiction module toxin [Elizabethkingia meningoseptica]|uniref:SymE family type I addiction module toxin n=2 Tax=Elizabethkingia meningoseptica TaxID=238 RepID=UPI00099499DD|nr:type I addiction module toxin, SymE family [Elizabethkingia meningoseptica]
MSARKKNSKRQMTICRKTFSRECTDYVSFPIITLTGKWLKESGFKIGQVIDIECRKSKLIITVAENQRFDLED